VTGPASFHVHTTFCDGNDSPEAMADAAVALGMSAIGFSAHAAWPLSSVWHLECGSYGDYLAAIANLKRTRAGEIDIFTGFEADWIPGVTAPDPAFYAEFKPDYLIGSVHWVMPERRRVAPAIATRAPNLFPAGLWSVDAPTEEVARGLASCFGGDGRKAIEAYWSAVRDMVSSCRFDIVGHLDLPRKRNGALKFFDEGASWYRRELKATVRAIARSGKIAEINTGAIPRKAMDDVYPSAELLSLLRRADVPVTVNSDAHSASHLTAAYDRAYAAARAAGYRELAILTPTGWKSTEF